MGGWGQTRVGHGPAEQGEHRRLGRRTDSPLRPQIRRCPVGANLDPSPGRLADSIGRTPGPQPKAQLPPRGRG